MRGVRMIPRLRLVGRIPTRQPGLGHRGVRQRRGRRSPALDGVLEEERGQVSGEVAVVRTTLGRLCQRMTLYFLRVGRQARVVSCDAWPSGMFLVEVRLLIKKAARSVYRQLRRLRGQCYVDIGDHCTTVFLAGVGRSGTTWLSQIINYDNRFRYMFEPFNNRLVNACKGFRDRQYLRPEDQDRRFLDVAQAVLAGRIRDLWVDAHNRKLIARHRFVKEIRVNLLLGWLHTHFPAMSFVLLLRHPCAVASSKIKMGWGTHLDEFLSQPELMEDHLAPFEDLLRTARDDFERHILLWCVETYVPLRQFRKNEIHVVFYETLCMQSEIEVRRLFAFLNLRVDVRVAATIKRPSAASRPLSAIKTGQSLTEGWRSHITNKQIDWAVSILRRFRLDRIYAEGPSPDPAGITYFREKGVVA